MDKERKGANIRLKGWWVGRFWYLPIGLIIIFGYYLGAHLTFILYFDSSLHQNDTLYANDQARFYLHLFGASILGGSLHCSYLYAKDANEKIHTGIKLPTIFDCLGYFIYILGSGITGVVFYFFAIGSVVILSQNGVNSELKPQAAGIVAFIGGYSTDGVKAFVRLLFYKATSKAGVNNES
ncbi:TPA: hypothetical protein NJ448_004592 [Vibrio parahaemolyticus]|uniref:hypothetical protein n=1 Tax=Vibrio parahaemolyticus TaxID=670 RepID=UPI0010CE2A57|nr:hypothetical protein [Vibrio parahaemolyticus]MBE4057703.1 hypothetical protein [Vibrio parahaemolyticus]MBE4094153.1 hypothetical protein [Vibrio parahaemolyticus]MBE4336742.1 hypothetical protein [Vibrio parahaemolyticus]MBE4358879.1 hypothetical protein [Vibrio parahaemolyticus]MBE5141508.1 hypothetical protein [Vibrio parahaemolyticus]